MTFRCGKTTMARVLASRADATFREVSATIATANQVRAIFDEARDELQLTGRFVILHRGNAKNRVVLRSIFPRRTIVFLDEIHRFTRPQQVSTLYRSTCSF